MVKILVFGIFDGVHPGHVNFLKQAKRCGDFLIVAVGRSAASKILKNKLSKHSLAERLQFVRNVSCVDRVIAGDNEQGSYRVILCEKPDIICLGYDQRKLAANLKKWLKSQNFKIGLKILKPYKPRMYHSSLLNS